MRRVLTWLDENIIALLAGFLLIFIPLYPKLPLVDAIPGYLVRIRIEDVFVLLTSVILVVQCLRRKISVRFGPAAIGIGIYLTFGFLSILSGLFFSNTIPLVDIHVQKTIFHWLRRVEYFSLFFILFGAVTSMRRLRVLVVIFFITLGLVTLYGYGQKYLYWPAFSTMNREFAKGWLLYLTEHARVLSTFGGHYDLAGYLVIALSLGWSFFFGLRHKLAKVLVAILISGGFWLLILTASRISFIAYLVALSVVVALWSLKKGFKWGISRGFIAIVLSLLVMLSFGDLSDRFLRLVKLDRRITGVRSLVLSPFSSKPAAKAVFLENNTAAVTSRSDQPPTPVRPADVSGDEPELLVATYSATGEKSLVPKRRSYSPNAFVYDLSTAIRLDESWPRAVERFKANILFGSGYATLSKKNIADFTEAESTDNDYLRALGETGLFGSITFFGVIGVMAFLAFRALSGVRDHYIYALVAGFLGTIVGLLANATYIDIFEASKVAYVFWGVSGLTMGTIYLFRDQIKKDRQPFPIKDFASDVVNSIRKFFVSDRFIMLLIFVVCLGLRLYNLNTPLADWHSWRQADTSAVTRNFVRHHEVNWLYPVYDDLSSVASGKPNPSGYRFVEFPIYSAVSYFFAESIPELTVEAAGRLTSALMSSLSAVFLFLIARFLFNRRIALIVGAVFALIPYGIFYGRSVLPDPTMVTFSLGAIFMVTKYLTKPGLLSILGAVIFASLAMLVKPYAIFLLLPIGYLWLVAFGRKSRQLLVLIPLFVLSLMPFILWRVWMSQFPEGIPASDWLLNGDAIRFKGAFWYWLFADRIGRLVLGYWGLVLLAFGLVRKIESKYWLFPIVFFLSSVFYLVVFATGNVRHDYYQILLLPSISLLIGLGLDFLLFSKTDSLNPLITKSLGLLSLVFMLGFGWYFVRDLYNINHPEIVEAGQKVRELTDWKALIVAPYDGDTAFLYQTDRRGWPVVEGEIGDMIDRGAHYYISVRFDDLTRQLMDNSWPVWLQKPDKVVRKYKTLAQNDKYVIIQLVPDKDLPPR